MKNLHRVVWSRGMFLTPQHFQSQDQYLEDHIQFRSVASTGVNWGLTDLAVDQEALTNGLFTVRHCRGVLPDGLTFNIPDADEPPPGREIAEFFPPTQADLDVFLAIPERRPRGRNVTIVGADPSEAANAGTRFVSSTRTILDEAGGVDEKPVLFARKNFRIALGGEAFDGNSAIRIAQVTRSAAGAYVLKREFIPPSLSIESGEYLLLLLRRQVELLAAKAQSLSAMRRQKGRNVADFGTGDVANFWLLYTVSTYLPRLKHYWTMRRVHPELPYQVMLALAGGLSTFALDEQARNLPDYDHENLGVCYTLLDEKIRELLETAIPSKCILVPLTLAEKSVWAGQIVKEEYFKKSQFFLSVSAAMGVDDVVKQVPKQVKISPPAEVQRLVRNALPGITLRHAPVPPGAIPVKLGKQYFSLNQSGILWDGIVKTQNVSIFVPEEIDKPELELLIVLE
ncbi:MAG TPA: type VI secretion system baseplate subunit TssK [Bryobacteraceae bacterium]|jgi:type VI secretion system protein ImpJ|nr:type VI secretion system baseplate subunit TssK [Bryobacteraceae bacterium]